jgi:hypothetical protein
MLKLNENQSSMTKAKTTPKNSFWHPLIITINLVIFLLFGNAINLGGVAQADPTTDGTGTTSTMTAPDGPKDVTDPLVAQKCQEELARFADPEFENYKTFMEDNFKNKSSTSSLLDLGIARYDKFKGDIYGKFNQLMSDQLTLASTKNSSNAWQGSGLEKCQELANQYIDDASKLLTMRAISTSNIKKTSVFVEKYQQINTKLRALNEDMMRMVVNISAFEQKLPCYLRTCI